MPKAGVGRFHAYDEKRASPGEWGGSLWIVFYHRLTAVGGRYDLNVSRRVEEQGYVIQRVARAYQPYSGLMSWSLGLLGGGGQLSGSIGTERLCIKSRPLCWMTTMSNIFL